MHTTLKTGAVAATLLAAVAMTTTPSEARCRGCAAAAGGFVAGAAVGAIAANSYNNYYAGPGYAYGYGYAPGYAYYGSPGYAYGGPAYYNSYAYAPRQSYSQYRDGTGYVGGTDWLSDR